MTEVMRFGGPALKDSASIGKAALLVSGIRPRGKVVVVASAMKGITEQLTSAVRSNRNGNWKDAAGYIEQVRDSHRRVVSDLGIRWLEGGPPGVWFGDNIDPIATALARGRYSIDGAQRLISLGSVLAA